MCLSHGIIVPGSLFTLVGELLLLPSALKQRSWSTILVAVVFVFLALATLSREFLS